MSDGPVSSDPVAEIPGLQTLSGGVGPVDALVVLSFGGPDGPEDVRPFLENVTRGRGVPPERLDEVAEHYHHLGGRSPLNELNLDIIDRTRRLLAERGRNLPVYFANRNWHPLIEDTVRQMAQDGVRTAAVFATSAWGGYSGCAQYQEDITRARDAVEDAPEMYRLRQFHDHPLFVDRFARDLADAVDAAGHHAESHGPARVVFTAHSVPASADASAGPESLGGHLYSRQVAEAARLIADGAGVSDFDVVWQSRSGPPHIPWLEPDVVDHVRAVASDQGARNIVVCPVGFVSDHVEVVWDLDHELAEDTADLDVRLTRCATPGPTEEFSELIIALLEELETGVAVGRPGSVASLGCTRNGARCATDCCVPLAAR